LCKSHTMPGNTTTIGRYFLDRVAGLGITAIFGVPGDFNLAFLDLIEEHPKLEWIGCCNELNAAYAADGYARVTGKPGVLLTTFGVGELSCINGVAGSFSERIPIVHLVGVPSTKLQAHKALLHHTLGDGRFDAFTAMSSHVTAAQALLISESHNAGGKSATEEIDRVLKVCVKSARPVYITLPTDLVFTETSAHALEHEITVESLRKEIIADCKNKDLTDFVVKQIVELYKNAEKPVILIDACAVRYGVQDLCKQLVEATNMPFFTSPMGKTALDEQHPNFSGVYIGSVSTDVVKDLFESSDFVLNVGSLKSDFNTGSFSYHIKEEQSVELHSDGAKVQYANYPGLSFHVLLPRLIEALSQVEPKGRMKPVQGAGLAATPQNITGDVIRQKDFWPTVASGLRKGDVTLAETGTSSFGILDAQLPSGTTHCSQVLWGSIGWATGCVLGASYAAKKLGRRCVLFTGEGSAQETIQDVSTIIRLGLTPILFILNNKGYTIERFIHGKTAAYNDVPSWDWQNLLTTLGAKEGQTKSYSIRTPSELEKLLKNEDFQAAKVLQLVEVHMDAEDAPRALQIQAELSEKANSG